jgi:Phosphate transporter family
MEYALIAIALFLAFNNGANDNFKGFATVWGSETLNYRQASILATLATLAGSMASWLLANTLLQQFSGKGLVPDAIASTQVFIFSVASAAALTVFLATKLGFPISTTHVLIGGLVGVGLGQAGGRVDFTKLAQTFFVPVLLSPLLAAGLGIFLYKLVSLRKVKNDCACVVEPSPVLAQHGSAAIDHQRQRNLRHCRNPGAIFNHQLDEANSHKLCSDHLLCTRAERHAQARRAVICRAVYQPKNAHRVGWIVYERRRFGICQKSSPHHEPKGHPPRRQARSNCQFDYNVAGFISQQIWPARVYHPCVGRRHSRCGCQCWHFKLAGTALCSVVLGGYLAPRFNHRLDSV